MKYGANHRSTAISGLYCDPNGKTKEFLFFMTVSVAWHGDNGMRCDNIGCNFETVFIGAGQKAKRARKCYTFGFWPFWPCVGRGWNEPNMWPTF